MISGITVSLRWIVREMHLLVTFQRGEDSSTLEYRVSKEGEQYRMTIVVFGTPVFDRLSQKNPLETVTLASERPAAEAVLASDEAECGFTIQATYAWWDGVRQITGPSYQVKYHHPDRDYYQMAPWADWSRNGYECSHNQMNQVESNTLATAGWATFFAAIAAALAYNAGIYATVAAAILGGVLGALFGYFTQAILVDEVGCIWWWWGNDFQNWFMANLWWLVLWFQVGVGATASALSSIGYFRVRSYTFIDGQGFGNP